MKNIIALCILACFTTTRSTAKDISLQLPEQQTDKNQTNEIRGLYAFFPLEFPIIDNSAINNALVNASLPESQYGTLAFGGGFQLQFNQYIVSLSIASSFKKIKSDTANISSEYISSSLNVGYDLLPLPEYALYPFAGYKQCSYNYVFKEKAVNQQTINSYLSLPLDHKELKNSIHHLDLGVGFSYRKQGLIELRAGYLVPIGNAKWKVNNNKAVLQNTPDISYVGYISLAIGLGGTKKLKTK